MLWVLTELQAEMPGNIPVFFITCQFCGRNQNTHSTRSVSDDGVPLVVWWLLMRPIWIVVPTGNITHPCVWLHEEWTEVLQVGLYSQVDHRRCHWWSQVTDAQWGHHLGAEKGQILCAREDLQNAERINSDTVSGASEIRLHCVEHAGSVQRY